MNEQPPPNKAFAWIRHSLLLGAALLLVTTVFAGLFEHWLDSLNEPLTGIFASAQAAENASPSAKGGAPTAANGSTSNEDHLIRMQEGVLHMVESLGTKSKDELDFAILTVGFVGSLVLAVFIFFGWQTFKDTRRVTTEGERIIKLLESAHTNAEKALAEVRTMKEAVENEIKSAIQPQLREIAVYVLKSAELVGTDLEKLSFEDRLSIIDEAAAAITEARLGAGANSTLSYIWAQKGLALMERGDLLAAAQSLELSVGLNARRKPDRPYNLACVYAKMAAVVASRAEYIRKAVAQLEASLQLATDQAKESTDSRAYYRQKIRTDSDLDGIRGDAEFQKFQQRLPQDG